MENLKLEINVNSIIEQFDGIKQELVAAINDGVKTLATATHAKVVEMAQEELHSTRDKYIKALDFEEIAPGVWVVSVDLSKVGWIEEGKQAGSMVDDLLKNKYMISRTGERYRPIPFEYSKPPSQLNDRAKQYVSRIKSELKKRSIPFKEIERDAMGRPKLGRLHSLNIASTYPSARANTPALHGLTIYQWETESGNIRRDIMTFRMVMDGHKAQNKWFHPGVTPKKFLDRAMEWAEKTFQNEILPKILNKFK